MPEEEAKITERPVSPPPSLWGDGRYSPWVSRHIPAPPTCEADLEYQPTDPSPLRWRTPLEENPPRERDRLTIDGVKYWMETEAHPYHQLCWALHLVGEHDYDGILDAVTKYERVMPSAAAAIVAAREVPLAPEPVEMVEEHDVEERRRKMKVFPTERDVAGSARDAGGAEG